VGGNREEDDDDDKDQKVTQRRNSIMTQSLTAIAPNLSCDPAQWKKWVRQAKQGRTNSLQERYSFSKHDKWSLIDR